MENTVMTRISTFFWYSSIFFSLRDTFLFHWWGSLQFANHWMPQSHVPNVGMFRRVNYSVLKMKAAGYPVTVEPDMMPHHRRMQSICYTFERITILLLKD
jgi:hypothetical protein